MSAGAIALIVIILVLVAAGAALASIRLRSRAAGRTRPGPEYDRLVREVGPRRAKAEFAKRRQRVAGLDLKSLSGERRAAYTSQWTAAQEQFVDSPGATVRAAADLVTAVAADRGYEVGDRDQFLTDLSVYHGRYLDGYRSAADVTGRVDRATTEAMRQALLGYRALFLDLIEAPGEAVLARDREAALTRKREAGPLAGRDQAPVPGQRPWRQVTHGRHWKTQRQGDARGVGAPRP